MSPESYSFFFTIGTLLPGYVAIVPMWAAGLAWNFFFKERKVNVWTLPLVGSLVLVFLGALGGEGQSSDQALRPVVFLGFLPAALFCCFRWWRARQELSKERAPEF